MHRIKKTSTSKDALPGGIVKVQPKEDLLRFSFKLFDKSDEEMCPPLFPDGYVRVLMSRLRELEAWTVKDFESKQNKTVRNHSHDWKDTARKKGFSNLPQGWDDYKGWQFCLSANEHGRVHGILSGGVFHVIWLDCNHALYPEKT